MENMAARGKVGINSDCGHCMHTITDDGQIDSERSCIVMIISGLFGKPAGLRQTARKQKRRVSRETIMHASTSAEVSSLNSRRTS